MLRRFTLFLAFAAIGTAGYLLRRGGQTESDDGRAPPPPPPRPHSLHVGKIGERLKDISVSITKVQRIDDKDEDGEELITTLVLMRDGQNNLIKWITSGDKVAKLPRPGSRASLGAKVKAHESDGTNNEPCTLVSHCRIIPA